MSRLSRHDDHPVEGSCSIYRGSGSILQYLYVLYIGGVEAGDGGADQRRCVSRRKLIEAKANEVLVDSPVNYPKGLYIT